MYLLFIVINKKVRRRLLTPNALCRIYREGYFRQQERASV